MGETVEEDKRKLHDNYAAFSKTLSTWLVTYGIAFLAFIASQNVIVDTLQNNVKEAKCIVILVLIGIGSQVVATFLYKAILAYLSHGELKADFKGTRRYRVCDNIYYAYWFEIATDAVTLIAYFYATFTLSMLVFKGA